jgi:hypothetical protein
MSVSDEESERARIDYAQRIISGEFKHLVILMVPETDVNSRHTYYEGGRFQAIGLMEAALFAMKMRDYEDD